MLKYSLHIFIMLHVSVSCRLFFHSLWNNTDIVKLDVRHELLHKWNHQILLQFIRWYFPPWLCCAAHDILDMFIRVLLTELILPYLGNLWNVTKKHHWLSWSWLECQYNRIWLGLVLEEDISNLNILMSTNQTFMLVVSFPMCIKVNNWTWIFSILNLTIEYYWSFLVFWSICEIENTFYSH